jgi:hypothetical protein
VGFINHPQCPLYDLPRASSFMHRGRWSSVVGWGGSKPSGNRQHVKREIFVKFAILVIEGLCGRVRWFTTVGSPSACEKGDFHKISN